MNITLVKKLLQHNLKRLLKEAQENGQKTLITVHHDVEEIHQVVERQKKKKNGKKKRWKPQMVGHSFWMVANSYRSLHQDLASRCCFINTHHIVFCFDTCFVC